jgi:hypothetical protein
VNRIENAAGIERAAPGNLAAYRSLARHSGTDLATVLQHAENGTLLALIPETRGRTRELRSSRPGTVDPKQCLLVLWSKRERL